MADFISDEARKLIAESQKCHLACSDALEQLKPFEDIASTLKSLHARGSTEDIETFERFVDEHAAYSRFKRGGASVSSWYGGIAKRKMFEAWSTEALVAVRTMKEEVRLGHKRQALADAAADLAKMLSLNQPKNAEVQTISDEELSRDHKRQKTESEVAAELKREMTEEEKEAIQEANREQAREAMVEHRYEAAE